MSESPARAPIHIDDLAAPRWPLAWRLANRVAAPFAKRVVKLDEASLLAAARQRERLDDFGDDSFREPLRVLLGALEREANLSPLGRAMSRQLLLGLLASRLRLVELLREHPEIREERIEAPVVILGLPRTGTTHLHNLLAEVPELRSLPYWESLEPIPPAAVREGRAPDARHKRCAGALKVQDFVMPLLPAMHEMSADAPHEEIQLLAIDFRTMFFEASTFVPSYGAWYRDHDQTGAYRHLKLLLQTLQWFRGPKRWVLKSPQHLEQIRPLMTVFPDARVVHTHRDPARVIASMCTMVAYGLRMQSAHVDPIAVGGIWGDRIAGMLEASLRDRPLVPPSQALDLPFDAFMADAVGSALRVCRFASLPAEAPTRRRLEEYQAANPRGRHGTIEYRLEEFGLDAASLRRRLRFYSDHFAVREE
jgi:hypothetical protein